MLKFVSQLTTAITVTTTSVLGGVAVVADEYAQQAIDDSINTLASLQSSQDERDAHLDHIFNRAASFGKSTSASKSKK